MTYELNELTPKSRFKDSWLREETRTTVESAKARPFDTFK
jgi:hypothetical protein